MNCIVLCRADDLIEPYYIFKRKGYEVTLASVRGGPIPIDPESLKGEPSPPMAVRRYLEDRTIFCLKNQQSSLFY